MSNTNCGPMKLSPSAVKAYRSCPYRYALDYIQRLPQSEREPVPMLGFGNAVHQALADFIRKGGWTCLSKDDLIALFTQYWDGSIYSNEYNEMSLFHHGRRLLETYYDHPYPAGPVTERGVELRLNWATPRKNIVATGKIDRLYATEDGRLIVLDYKTGRHHPEDAGTLLVQAGFYRSLVADQISRNTPLPIEVVFYFLGSQTPLAIEFTHDEFLGIWQVIEGISARIRASTNTFRQGRPLWAAFPLHRGRRCLTCPMRKHCEQLNKRHGDVIASVPPKAEGGV